MRDRKNNENYFGAMKQETKKNKPCKACVVALTGACKLNFKPMKKYLFCKKITCTNIFYCMTNRKNNEKTS